MVDVSVVWGLRVQFDAIARGRQAGFKGGRRMSADTSTIIGVFDRYTTAEQAARKLAEIGIPQQAIQIKSNLKTEAGRPRSEDEPDTSGISGFFRRLFGTDTPEEHVNYFVRRYADVIGRGGALICVTAASEPEVDRAVDILNHLGAIDDEKSGGRETARTSGPTAEYPQSGASDTNVIPVIEEELQVGKRVVRRGGVRIYSRIVERPAEEEVALREEHVQVERRPVDRPVTPEDEAKLREESFEVTEMAEEPVINKRRRIKEEVIVGKEATEKKREGARDSQAH